MMNCTRIPLGVVLLLALQEQARLQAERIDAASLNKAADAAAADYAKSRQSSAETADRGAACAAAMSAVHVAAPESACDVNPTPAPDGWMVDYGTIGHAVALLHRRPGTRVRRSSWPEGVWLELVSEDRICLFAERSKQGISWRAQQCEILAKDWTLA